jgi:hypothetical protein
MSFLQFLRQTRLLASGMLAWVLLSMAVAVAAPIVNPQATAMVCSGTASVKLVNVGGDDSAPSAAQHGLDCVLCLAFHAPNPPAANPALTPPSLSHVLSGVPVTAVAWHAAPPLSARGPPSL